MDSGNINQVEVNSPMESTEQQDEPKNDTLVASQSSIFLLTLDEFQNSLSENGKNFGSMNMDEFLNTIWTAEEQAQEQAQGSSPPTTGGGNNPYATTENAALMRQASLSVPSPLCSKTVDEVWSEIHKSANINPNSNPTAERQTTFGDMTLEDFLVRAGIVRPVQHFAPSTPYDEMQQQQQQNMMGVNVVPPVGPASFIARSPMMGMGGGGVASYPTGVVYPNQPSPAVGYGGRMGNVGSGGYGVQGIGSPGSPVSSGGPSQIDGGGFGVGRKRILDGPVERVVERRQRRMIKNRESAARSRARKQAYTVELEAELNQLKEENEQLKQALQDEQERNLRQQFDEEERANKKLRTMRRTSSY